MKPLNTNLFKPLFAILAVALACVCMWGCSDTEFRWNEERSGAKVVGFVNDSLVMVGDYRCWTEITDGVGANYKDIDGCGQERLCVYNYRVQEDGPRWCDSLSDRNSIGIFGMEVHSTRPSGQMTDSVIWGGHIDNSIRLWKIGELPHEIRLNKKMEGCSVDFTVQSVKQWLDGTFIARGEKSLNADGDGCQYAVLDTLSKTITYKRLDKDLEWIKQCDDVRAWGNDVYCLALDENNGNSFVLKNGVDSIFAPMEKIYDGHFSGNMIELGVRVCSLINNVITCPDVKWTGNRELEFYRNDGAVIRLPSPN